MKKNRLIELYLYIKELNSKEKYKEVVKYADKYFEFNDNNMKQYNKVLFMKAKSLRMLERFDECIDILEKQSEKKDMFFTMELFFVYYYLNRYEDALKLLPTLYEYPNKDFKNYSLSIMETVMKKQLGLFVSYSNDEYGANIKKQILKYDEAHAIETIKMRKTYSESNYLNKDGITYFNENVNVDYLFNCTKNNLKNNKKLNINEIFDIYYFLVPNIGLYNNDICNAIKVVVCPNTTNIITLYPVSTIDINNVPILNCDFDKLFNNQKVYKKV